MIIAYILTAPQMAGFLRGQISALRASGFVPTIFSPEATAQIKQIAHEEGAALVIVKMRRSISPWHDLVSTLQLTHQLWRLKPEVVVTIGPKAGLLGGVASCIIGVPCRIQTKWGIRLETTTGLLRRVLTVADKIAGACAHLILCDSLSGKQRTAELGLAPAHKIRVVANGSANGINTKRFAINPANQAAASAFRAELGISSTAPLVGFVGRLNLDKGLIELREAWALIVAQRPDATLAIIGEDECKSTEEKLALAQLKQSLGVKILGPRTGVEGLFMAMDVFLMPSHREGFGVVVLEAAAMEVPTVGFNVTGMKDSVLNHTTGVLVELGDVKGLARATLTYLGDVQLKKQHGQKGRQRVEADFRPATVWRGYFETYRDLAEARNLDTRRLKWNPPT